MATSKHYDRKFKFIGFNPRRFLRGKEAARVEVDGQWIWMSRQDVEFNIRDFGPCPELLKASEAYKTPSVEILPAPSATACVGVNEPCRSSTESVNGSPVKLPRCSNCQWWFGDDSQYRVCVFHTGLKTAKTRRIDYGGSKPMKTAGEFGCVDWQKDTRPSKLRLHEIPPLE